MTYNDGPTGSLQCRRAIAHFLDRHLNPFDAIDVADHVVTNGVSAATEHCSWALRDPGDGVLLDRPYYRSFLKDLGVRPDVRVVPVSFGTGDPLAVSSVTLFGQALHTSCEQGVKIRAIVLCNLHNHLGRCYSREFLIELMKLCQKYCIHHISDEIYALSVWPYDSNHQPPVMQPFTSALSINPTGIIDPALIHVLWGTSKDFGANGFRCGVIISRGHFQEACCRAILCWHLRKRVSLYQTRSW
jgi:1-aminocyclopropane-1-carboxylate synthase